ncbi:PLP-dependent transferase [Algoriphagus algorifonticola]|uniref:PLP-dependent transferase n=1 Tax=Algoriphagus algorifonticola TaxID=2593007 RepID=UPI0011A3D5BD|nr:PLP-dependent transferase [Algoriphagus algorifonticola]
MNRAQIQQNLQVILKNMPADWLNLTTHRLDIYEESLAKTQFLEHFKNLVESGKVNSEGLKQLPTAYDYIRLGHPLSSVLEWAIAELNNLPFDQVISFSSKTTPILAVLRKNLFLHKKTQIVYSEDISDFFGAELIREVYGFEFELLKAAPNESLSDFDGSRIFVSPSNSFDQPELSFSIDFAITIHGDLGSIIQVIGAKNASYISEIQHVRRRESIAMTPANCFTALEYLAGNSSSLSSPTRDPKIKDSVLESIANITGTDSKPLVASSGLSIQYAIMMGLVHDAMEKHPGKEIKFIVPPNCYGGTNDQARRLAACLPEVEIVDLPVDAGNDMNQSLERILGELAQKDAIPYIIAEIPTNPRVEVPDLKRLKEVLSTTRQTENGETAIEPVFILDQTFCPNVQFLPEGETLSVIPAISYASGSKFPSGGECTAGYCVANLKAENLMDKIALHLALCDNEATAQQYEILARQLPSMNQRIQDAYVNTRDFVNFIQDQLPSAKINFVSEELAERGFTPSVFSLDLPTKGNTEEEREAYKRALNLELINKMITEIPDESKFCVSYGQLKGCYWTVPATSTQGTTKEGDKDYIVRASVSHNIDLERHKEVFKDFAEKL